MRKIKALPKRLFAGALCAAIMLAACGCNVEIKPDSAADGEYSTQTPMTAVEYAEYLNKQVTVMTNQLMTRLTAVKGAQTVPSEDETALARETLKVMEDILEEVTVTKPATTADDDREATITAMETAVKHMEDYVARLEQGEDVSGFMDHFRNDINALTGTANLYYQ